MGASSRAALAEAGRTRTSEAEVGTDRGVSHTAGRVPRPPAHLSGSPQPRDVLEGPSQLRVPLPLSPFTCLCGSRLPRWRRAPFTCDAGPYTATVCSSSPGRPALRLPVRPSFPRPPSRALLSRALRTTAGVTVCSVRTGLDAPNPHLCVRGSEEPCCFRV